MQIADNAKKNKLKIDADERGYSSNRRHFRLINHITQQRAQRTQSIAAMFFATILARPGKSPKPHYRTRMMRMTRIFTDPCVSVLSVQSVFYFTPSALQSLTKKET